MLIAILIVVTLVPNLTLGAMLWRGVITTPWSRTTMLSPHESSTPADQSAIASVVLTAPAMLDATAGEDIALPIALDGTDGLPARSIVAISGLPQGSSLSNGRPYGKTEWTLKSDEIGDLHLVLPDTARGESKLTITLIAPDDRVIADAETVLNVAADIKGSLTRATQADSGDGALALGAILEPSLINIGLSGMESEPAVAQAWYEGAPAPGASGTERKLANLEAPKGMSGDAVPSQPNSPAQTTHDEDRANWIEPLAFVNLRQGPSSSAPVIGVVAKGAKLLALGRKHGWVEVTDPATSKKGWIYSGNLAGATKAPLVAKRATHSAAQSGSDSFWSGLGQWLSSP
jgi:Bacterial SH3 domain